MYRDFLLVQNKARPHITQAQLAMATTAVYRWSAAGRPSGNSAGTAELKQPEMAKNAGVHPTTIKQAKAVQLLDRAAIHASVSRWLFTSGHHVTIIA